MPKILTGINEVLVGYIVQGAALKFNENPGPDKKPVEYHLMRMGCGSFNRKIRGDAMYRDVEIRKITEFAGDLTLDQMVKGMAVKVTGFVAVRGGDEKEVIVARKIEAAPIYDPENQGNQESNQE